MQKGETITCVNQIKSRNKSRVGSHIMMEWENA
jgi:hypothetical protein